MSKKETKIRVNPVKFLKLVIILIVICGLLIGAGYLLGSGNRDNRNTEISAVVVQNKISSISQLATVTYAYTELGQYESSKDFYGVTVPFTTNKFILTYDGVIKAGIDMSKVQVEVKEKMVTVTLPEAEVLSHEIDEDSVKIFDEKTSIFNPFTVKEYTAFYADQKTSVEEKALAKGLLTEASTQGKSAIEGILEPVIPDDWTLEIK